MKREFLVGVLFLAVVLVTNVIAFTAPATAADLDGSTWDTDYGLVEFTQSGNSVTGTYTSDNGELTGTLEGQDFRGWWRGVSNVKECGPGNAWVGPVILRFSNDWMSFYGAWGYCYEGVVEIDDLDPENPDPERGWDGTLIPVTTTTTTIEQTTTTTSTEPTTSTTTLPDTSTSTVPAILTTTTTPADTTTTTTGDCPPETTACGDRCCDDDQECCGGECCDVNKDAKCCGDECCEIEDDCCDNRCCLKCTIFFLYGEYSEEAELLRDFRDNVLSQTPVGQEIIRLYYELSPAIVKAMEADAAYKEEVKGMVDGVLVLIGGVE